MPIARARRVGRPPGDCSLLEIHGVELGAVAPRAPTPATTSRDTLPSIFWRAPAKRL